MRRLNPRVREPIGHTHERPQSDHELWRLMESGDTSTATMEWMAELLGQHSRWEPPDPSELA